VQASPVENKCGFDDSTFGIIGVKFYIIMGASFMVMAMILHP
jgi:hypothetical protein